MLSIFEIKVLMRISGLEKEKAAKDEKIALLEGFCQYRNSYTVL
jgi:hypothetical protein